MPKTITVQKAKADLKAGKAPSTAAGEFVKEEIEHVRQGKHGARSPQQAIAIGLSKARRAGVPLQPPRRGKAGARTRAARDLQKGQSAAAAKTSRSRSRAGSQQLKHEPRSTASPQALARQARSAARRRKAS